MIFLGFFNGLLPCGLSFGAAILSVNMGTWSEAMAYMLLFGIGTAPVLIAMGLLPRLKGVDRRLNLNKWLPRLMVLTGLLLILRLSRFGHSLRQS